MKSLSVRAPWWWAILHLGKDVENRDWGTNFRGRVLIHASKWWNVGEISDDWEAIRHISGAAFSQERLVEIATQTRDAGGCLVGAVDIVNCVSESNSPWFFGDYGFVLRNPIVFRRPIPFRGSLGFFEVPDDLVAAELDTAA